MFVVLMLGGQISFANNSPGDRLKVLLSKSTEDSDRIVLMSQLTEELINVDFEEAKVYAQQALDLSRKIGDQTNEAKALNNMGLILYETSNRSESLKYFEKSEQLADKLGLRKLQVMTLMSIAKYHRYTSRDSAKTVQNFLKSSDISKSINFHWGTGRSYAKLASFYTRYNQVDLCEKYLEQCAEYYALVPGNMKTIAHYYTEVGDKIWAQNPRKSMDLYFKGKEYKLIPNLMVSLAKAHNFIGENAIALNYIEEAIPYFQKTEKRRRMLGIAISQLAEIYIQLGDYAAADKSCNEGIELLAKLSRSDQNALPDLYRIKAIISQQRGNDEKAFQYLNKSISEAIRVKHAYAHLNAILALGVFQSTRDVKQSKIHCEESLINAKQKNFVDLEIASCNCLYNVHKTIGDYKTALRFVEQKITLKDSVNALTVNHALDINNKIAEKDQLIAEQSFQKELKDNELKNQYIIISSLIISLLLGLLLFVIMARSHRRIRKKNKEINEKTSELLKANVSLERSNEELERFAHIASHDLKTPIRSIVSFTSLIRRQLENGDASNIMELLGYVENGGKRMNSLIEDVLEYSQLGGKLSIAHERIDLNQMMDEIAQLIKSTQRDKQVNFEISELPHIHWIHSRIYLLFKNLIENGIKYNKSEIPAIKVYYKATSDSHAIYVEDNGIGIKEEYFKNIFVMFKRLHNHSDYEGTGLGLATCQKIAENFEGSITLSSEVNVGSTFKIEIPSSIIRLPPQLAEADVNKSLQEV